MGLFSKTPKPNPKVIIEGLEVEFRPDYGGWQFQYQGTEFLSFQPALTMPTKAQLDSMLETVESLKPDLRARLQKGLKEWGDSKLDDGESYSINVKDFAIDRSFTLSWSGGKSWGDLGADFTIKDHAIVDESWGD
jgi:hypothetical protein